MCFQSLFDLVAMKSQGSVLVGLIIVIAFFVFTFTEGLYAEKGKFIRSSVLFDLHRKHCKMYFVCFVLEGRQVSVPLR